MKIRIPEISIIVCCYNHEKWIERCLRSILHQKYIKDNEFEVIIVDDNSSDRSHKIIKKFNFDNFISLKNKKNIGLPLSINKAISKAKADTLSELTRMTMFQEIFYILLNYF